MRFRFLSFLRVSLVAGCSFSLLSACSVLPWNKKDVHSVELESKPGLAGKKASAKNLTIELRASPDPLKLGEVRQLDVTMVIRNPSKKPVSLKFATTQLIEILLRDPATGKVVTQWSTDQTFLSTSRYLVINPKERLEYNQPIATRDLHAGKTYMLEAYLVGYDQDVRASRQIVPQP